MKHFLTLFILLIIQYSCSGTGKKDNVLVTFDKEKTLDIKKTKISSDDLGEIMQIHVFDSLLLVSQINQEYIYSIFNLNNGKLIKEVVRRGNGPNEIVFPQGVAKYNDTLFSFYEGNKDKLFFYNILSLINGEDNPLKIISLNNRMGLRYYPLNDSILIGTGIYEKGRYCYINLKNGFTDFYLDYPLNDKLKNLSNRHKGMAFQSSVCIHPDKDRFVSTTSGSAIFEILKINNPIIDRIIRHIYYFGEHKIIYGNIASSKESPLAFLGIEANSEYIFALYSGKSIAKEGESYIFCNNLLVYDWNGTPLINVKLKTGIKSIALDNESSKIYGFTVNNETALPEIVELDITNLFEK